MTEARNWFGACKFIPIEAKSKDNFAVFVAEETTEKLTWDSLSRYCADRNAEYQQCYAQQRSDEFATYCKIQWVEQSESRNT